MMTAAQFEALATPAGRAALAAATDLAGDAKALFALRKRFPADLAAAAFETAELRTKAAAKFPDAAKLFFTREALEQATSTVVAEHRAKRFAHFKRVLDLGCGIGGDAIALARAGCDVIAVENDPVRAAMAAANLAALGLPATVLTADALTDALPLADAVFCDPARRRDGRRFLGLHDYAPDPFEILKRFEQPVAFKIAPGVAWNELESIDGEFEFVSLKGELKECVLWLRGFKTTQARATLLPSGATLAADASVSEPPPGPLGKYLYDPDPAVERAKLTGLLAEQLNATSLDTNPAYLTNDTLTRTPFAKAFEVVEAVKYDRVKLNALLRSHDVGRVTLHAKNTPESAAAVQKGLKLGGTGHRHVMLTRVEGQSTAVLVREC